MYQALYRQYRPRVFDDVLGQEHVVNTIKNQIKNDNIGHAYLFSGTRGTGKTSTAKIFSRAVNCLEPENGNPCNKCHNCLGILDGSIMDVIEMDAASNRGVNDIRELRDKVAYPPSHGRYKVYIIDEVHMLTQEAFNALLKTLEEPPKHLIFILATTEPERIPATILSRCQRFDFKRISVEDIIRNMEDICRSLDVEYEDRALSVIARNADGGMRDALSILDQALSFASGSLAYEDAVEVLGIVNMDTVFTMVNNIIGKDLESILLSIDEFLEEGRDVDQFIKDIIKHFRDILIVKTSKKPEELLAVDSLTMDNYREQAESLELDYIFYILDVLTEANEKLKFSTEPRVLLELSMIKLVRGENRSLEERLSRLEAMISSGNYSPGQLEPRPEAKKPELKLGASKAEKEAQVPKREVKGPKEPEEKPVAGNTSTEARAGEVSLEDISSDWESFLSFIRRDRPNVSGFLIEGRPKAVENKMLQVEFPKGYDLHIGMCERHKDYIEEAIKKYFKTDLVASFIKEGAITIDKTKKKETGDLGQEIKDFFGEDRVTIK